MKSSKLWDMRYRWLSIPVSVLTVVLVHFLNIPNPMMILIIPVVYFAYSDGYIGGILSGLIALAYSLYFFSNPGELFRYDDLNVKKVLTIVLAVAVIITLVGRLRGKATRTEKDIHRANANFMNILSGVDVQLLVTEPVTDAILFANNEMNERYSIDYDPTGMPCYRVYQGEEKRCEFCPLDDLEKTPAVPIEWERKNERTGRWFRNRDAMIEWTDGRMVHLQQAVDITKSKQDAEFLRQRLAQESVMSRISQSFISVEDTASLIHGALQSIGTFLEIDRCILLHAHDDGRTLTYNSSWFSGEACCLVDKDAEEALRLVRDIREVFAQDPDDVLICEDVRTQADMETMRAMDVMSLVVLPVFVDERLWGVLSLEKCYTPRIFSESDIALAKMVRNTISGVITREKMEKEIIHAKELAEASNRAKSEFLSRMSHEIRTPMNAIIGMTEIAKKTDDLDRIRGCLMRVDDASNHLLGVINDILDMSKIEAGKFELSESDFVLEHMLQRVSNVNNFRFEQKEQHFTIVVDTAVPTAIVTDQQRLAQVITNLLSNAAKFTPHEGHIDMDIHLESEEDGYVTLRFEVKDEGIGMTAEQQGRLFQSFEQADGSITRRFGGTGLGLAISKRIVEMMGGRIWVQSQAGKGSTFAFTIRVKKGFATRASHLSANIDWSQVRLLAVDDSEEVRRYFSAIMESLGIACDVVSGGEEAIEKMRDNAYQIVFIDWLMPVMTGIELAGRLRALYGEQAQLVMFSSTDWMQIAEQANAVGITHFISKPLLPSTIIDCINECFGEKKIDVADRLPTDDDYSDIFLGRKLLLVEDIEINREIIRAMLEDTGIEIVEAENGQSACDIFAQTPDAFDLIFMDIHMPIKDGYAATQEIRAREDLPGAKTVPIIAMTANVFKEDIERCLAAGMNDHVGKPIDMEEMLQKMKRFMPVRR